MELAFSIGISPMEFWEMEPYEIGIAVRGYHKRKEAEAEEYHAKLINEKELLVYQAYLISKWVWQKKITQKDLDEAVGRKKKTSRKMTADEMLKQVMAINMMFGGEVKNGTEE